jgi:hypothetical protein
MRIEVSEPGLVSELRLFLQRNSCPSEQWSEDMFEVRVLRSPGEPRSEADDRMKVFGHLREWCAEHPGVKTNILG